ncbi:GNAT family N-acetyltransferase [Prosthecochloris sp. SCSIO W1101]|uniref:GNAT family N-acetyltransferase n=1 Tax=Prosthecochloris sp. SCSIO W1101 TaxID=2992242 RepID=UPI00223E7157|nr:GNAT family N-acetyltransferase [Prosthecochloris sp. SCSIO W1101]UZJ42531.1 GNAT family N-acetyltransferase [Prosthecochloris sp. SCSIO W1101]
MIIRSATLDDIDRCIELLTCLFDQEAEFSPNPERQRKGLLMIIQDPSRGTILVAEDPKKGFIAGMTVLLYTVSTALGRKVVLLEDLIIDPAYRSRGIGTNLITHAIHLAENEGFTRITLLTDKDNGAAHDFYQKQGFNRSGMVVFRRIISPLR